MQEVDEVADAGEGTVVDVPVGILVGVVWIGHRVVVVRLLPLRLRLRRRRWRCRSGAAHVALEAATFCCPRELTRYPTASWSSSSSVRESVSACSSSVSTLGRKDIVCRCCCYLGHCCPLRTPSWPRLAVDLAGDGRGVSLLRLGDGIARPLLVDVDGWAGRLVQSLFQCPPPQCLQGL